MEPTESSRYPPRSPAGLSVNFDYPHTSNRATSPSTVYTDTVPILVEPEWGAGITSPMPPPQSPPPPLLIPAYQSIINQSSRLQLCPAIFAPSAQHIPQVVKHIYARLAAAAIHVDQGVSELLISLIGTGCSLDLEDTEKLIKGFSRIVTRCGFWAISNGEVNDPLANAIACTIRNTLPQRESSEEETLHIVVNSLDIVCDSETAAENVAVPMVDSRYNTFYIIWNQRHPDEHEMLKFRSCMAINLANPPPALLIGVPSNAPMQAQSSTGSFDDHHYTVPQTPQGAPPGAMAPTIILPASADGDRVPLPVVLFAGATLTSLIELNNNLQCGVPVLVIQDACELCNLLKSCSILYQSSGFEHNKFIKWVDGELRRAYGIVQSVNYNADDVLEHELDLAKSALCSILATAFNGEHSQLAFMPIANSERIAEYVLDLLVHARTDSASMCHILSLAVKLNISNVVRMLKLESILSSKEQVEHILLDALKSDEQIDVLSALLDQNIPIHITSSLLLSWLDATTDQYFFNTIILGHLLGFIYKLDRITEYVAVRINHLLGKLSGGIGCLFPIEYFDEHKPRFCENNVFWHNASFTHQNGKSVQTLAVWALLLNRTETVKILCAYANEPAALYLVLAKVSRNLARRSREWFFYEQKLLLLSANLNSSAVNLLNTAYDECSLRAYRALCHRPNLGSPAKINSNLAKHNKNPSISCDCALNRLTLAELAFEMNARDFIAHDCCQRFVLRLLYGNLQVRTISMDVLAPNWLKIITSAIFVVPISFWITTRPTNLPPPTLYGLNNFDQFRSSKEDFTAPKRAISPTVALLEDGRQIKRIRANSIYSMYSMKNNYLYEGGSAVGGVASSDFMQNPPRTPDSIQETDAFIFGASHQRTPSMGTGSSSAPTSAAIAADGKHKKSRMKKSSKVGAAIHLRTFAKLSKPKDKAPQRITRNSRNHFISDLVMFYATPITKYWLSLMFRLAYLLLFAYTIALPSCGFLSMDFFVWIWSFMWLVENLWIFNIRLQNCSWREMPWSLFDIAYTSLSLTYLLIARIVNTQITQEMLISRFVGGWYALKSIWALFLLYECYRTLFVYVPLSEILGPLLVRIKLMVVQDFINFLILVLLVIISSAIAIKATLYPDLDLTVTTLSETISWSFLQLLTTDLSVLASNEECKRQRLTLATYDKIGKCSSLSGISLPRCPASGNWPAQFTVLEYLVVLKVISWPILFALFARTAKRVDEEAQKIWRYQLYTLATNFAIRPFLPPPFTPLFFIALSCCRLRGGGRGRRFLWTLLDRLSAHAGDHPDVRGPTAAPSPALSTHSKFSTIYRNPSVPASKKCHNLYWRQLAISHWKKQHHPATHTITTSSSHMQLDEKLNLFFLLNNFYRDTPENKLNGNSAVIPRSLTTANTDSRLASYNEYNSNKFVKVPLSNRESFSRSEPISPISTFSTSGTIKSEASDTTLKNVRRAAVSKNHRNWEILVPNYRPSAYSKPIIEFPREIQKYVQDHSQQNLADIRRQWRQKRMFELLNSTQSDDNSHCDNKRHDTLILSGDGFPLNPYGRTGLSGRGEYMRFGPNRLYIYVIIVRDNDGFLNVLTTSNSENTSDSQNLKYNKESPIVTLPQRWRYGMQRADEFLSKLLFLVGVPDTDSQLLTSRAHLSVGSTDAHLAHVSCKPLRQDAKEMTDNAWIEADVWAADLSYLTQYANMIDDNYEWRRINMYDTSKISKHNDTDSKSAAPFLLENVREFVDLSLRAFGLT